MQQQPTQKKIQVVLLTGASTGLGLEIAKLLLQNLDQYHLIFTARESSIPRFAEHGIKENERVWIRALDITDRLQRRSVVSEAEKLGGIDILINNAGFAYRAVIEHVTEENRLVQLEINFRAPLALTRLVLPRMRAKRSGKIINISSVGGMMAMPTMGIYSASKFALEGATESLWYEVRPWNIRVSLIQPGFIHSESFQRVKYTEWSKYSAAEAKDPYHEHYANMSPFIEKLMKLSRATPSRVARIVVKTIQKDDPPLRVPATPDALLFSVLRRFLPRRWYHELLYRCLPGIKKWGISKACAEKTFLEEEIDGNYVELEVPSK